MADDVAHHAQVNLGHRAALEPHLAVQGDDVVLGYVSVPYNRADGNEGDMIGAYPRGAYPSFSTLQSGRWE